MRTSAGRPKRADLHPGTRLSRADLGGGGQRGGYASSIDPKGQSPPRADAMAASA
jgi:hypothetical protein